MGGRGGTNTQEARKMPRKMPAIRRTAHRSPYLFFIVHLINPT
jgi:hypothetical protein